MSEFLVPEHAIPKNEDGGERDEQEYPQELRDALEGCSKIPDVDSVFPEVAEADVLMRDVLSGNVTGLIERGSIFLTVHGLASRLRDGAEYVLHLAQRPQDGMSRFEALGGTSEKLQEVSNALNRLRQCLIEFASSLDIERPDPRSITTCGQALYFWQTWVWRGNNDPKLVIKYQDGGASGRPEVDFLMGMSHKPGDKVYAAEFDETTDTLTLYLDRPQMKTT